MNLFTFTGIFQKFGNCLDCGGELVGIASHIGMCPEKGLDFHIAYFVDIYKYKNWILANKNGLFNRIFF